MMVLDLSSLLNVYAPLIRRISTDSSLSACDVRHQMAELILLANQSGKGIGWVIVALRRICFHDGHLSWFLSLNDDESLEDQFADPNGFTPESALINKEISSIQQRQLDMLGEDGVIVLDALSKGTADLADRLKITPRRAQQMVEHMVVTIERTKNNDEMHAVVSCLAQRIREADQQDAYQQAELFSNEM